MLPVLAERTSHIRLGTAAILLNLYSPLKIAEIFRLLATLYPGRIDLGVCAGLAADPAANSALLQCAEGEIGRVHAGYESKIESLLAYLYNEFPANHRFAKGATPQTAATAVVWLMGTGPNSTVLSARHGTRLSYSLFHRSSQQDPDDVQQYRDSFKSNPHLREPVCNIAFTCICADLESEARKQQRRVESLVQGDIYVNVIGSPEQCRDQILDIRERFHADEITVYSMWDEFTRRCDACDMLAEQLEIAKPSIADAQAIVV
jgi:luciferase family oxidoreductase group 1